MKPTKQTILHDPAKGLHGNCLSAVLASLLHLPIEDVPLFITPETWVKDLNAWLRPFGLAYCMVEDFDCHIDAYGIEGLWHEVSGNTSRSKDVTRACVAKDGEFVFDPHPDDTGLTKITCHGFFIALEPWRILTPNYNSKMAHRTDPSAIPDALTNYDSFPDSAHVRLPVVQALVGCSSATVWRMVKRGTLPAPRKLSERVTAWNVGDLRKALAA